MEKRIEIKEENISRKGKRKILIIIFVLIILLLIILGSLGYCYSRYLVSLEEHNIEEISNKNKEALLNFSETLEYGSELSYEELLNKLIVIDNLVENTEIKVLINNQEIESDTIYKFDNVGNYNIKVLVSNIYNYMNSDKTKTIENTKESEVIVEDTKLPTISGVSDKEISVGEDINLLKGITAQDEVDGELEVSIEGAVNNKKAGEYIITVKATDKNENTVTQEFKVTVKEKELVLATKPNNTDSSSNSSANSQNTTTSTNKGNTSSSTTQNNSQTTANHTTNNASSGDSSTKNGRLQMATEEAKKVVSRIITPGMSDYDKAYAIFKYLHNNVSRQTNQSTEAYKTNYGNEAYAALILKKAACSGFCKAVTLMCNAAGLQSKHVNASEWTHQWNTVLINGEWIILDAQGGIFGGTEHPLQGY